MQDDRSLLDIDPKRYLHPYGGVGTNVGTFDLVEIERAFGPIGHHDPNEIGKVMDIMGEDREVLVYSTGRGTGTYRVVCINHRFHRLSHHVPLMK